MVSAKKDEWKCFGPAPISSQGQVTIPKPAREAAGFQLADEVWVFADEGEGRVLLTHEPLVEDLLRSAAEAARRKRSGQS